MVGKQITLAAFGLVLAVATSAGARDDKAWRASLLLSFGSVEDSGYGGKGSFGVGYEFDDTFSVELQGGAGVTEEIAAGPADFYHLEILLPATLTICSAGSLACPGSTIDLVVICGIGGARFPERWSPTVVAGIAVDSFLFFHQLEVGVRAGFVGHYDVIYLHRLVVMLQLNLGVVFRFGKH